jgi:hypothetical protein
MKYTSQTLLQYCNENKIQLTNEYNAENINREAYIEGKCIIENCINKFNKCFRQLIKTGAYCNPCMQNISKNKIRNSKVKYDIHMLIDFCNTNNIILLDDYSEQFINRDTNIEGICLNEGCENNFIKPFRQLLKIGGYCENCSKENGKVKIIETNLQKFGVDNPMKNSEIKEKLKQSIIKKYGVEHNSQSDEIKVKKVNTYLKNYGVTSHLKSPEIREQIKQTNLKKYGVENPQQNKEIRNKNYETNLKKYGVKHYFETQEFKNKVIQTSLERYGVPHHSQNAEVAETMLKCAYNKKQYKLPSGKLLDYQGYENFALDRLLRVEKIPEDNIITNRKDVPVIWYTDINNKKRRHYVDIFIPSQNRCIEVKSTWTNQTKNHVLEKQKEAKVLGYIYEVWIFDREGELINEFI